MGLLFSSWDYRDSRVLMVGLDNAGKTTILYQLKIGEVYTTVPTIGFNVEQLDFNGLKLLVWDIGGQSKLRRLWKQYYDGSDAVIFVIDANDKDRLRLAKEELGLLMSSFELKEATFLIFCNKTDIKGSMKSTEMWGYLELDKVVYNRDIRIFDSVASKNIGLIEGLTWLSEHLKRKISQSRTDSFKGYLYSLLSFKN